MKDIMSYKGYYGSVHYSDGDRIFHGKIEFIRSLVSYEGSDVDSLGEAFEDAVDDYLDLCTKACTRKAHIMKLRWMGLTT